MSKAPNYDGAYPEAGERIGPVWQQLWDAMEDGGWYRGPDLSRLLAKDVTESTVRSLLRKAAQKGVITARDVKMPRARNGYKAYRRHDSEVVRTEKPTTKIKNVT